MYSCVLKRLKVAVLFYCTLRFLAPVDFCLGYEFQIVTHFKSPFGGGVGDLTYNADGYLYATKKTTLGYGDKVYTMDPASGKLTGFFEHPSDPINQLKYITSCNGNVFVDHYPLVFKYVIYKIYPEDDIWTTFFEPDKEAFGGMACDRTDLIFTEEDYVYTINLSTQEETGREKFITLASYNGMTWDGEYLWGLATNELNRAILHKIDSGNILEEITLPSTLTNCRGLAYDGECFWTYVNGTFSPYYEEIVQVKIISGQTTTTIPTTTTQPVSTTTSSSSSTTTTSSQLCTAEELYGEYSEEAAYLRDFRDNVLCDSPEGQEIIRLYNAWNPLIIKTLEEDEEFKEDLKEIIDEILPLITREME